MCTVSMISDGWRKQFPERWPNVLEPAYHNRYASLTQYVTKAEFDALKAEVEELKKLLIAAKEFDAKTGQPECHMDEKVALIKRIAELVGVNMDDVFRDHEAGS